MQFCKQFKRKIIFTCLILFSWHCKMQNGGHPSYLKPPCYLFEMLERKIWGTSINGSWQLDEGNSCLKLLDWKQLFDYFNLASGYSIVKRYSSPCPEEISIYLQHFLHLQNPNYQGNMQETEAILVQFCSKIWSQQSLSQNLSGHRGK